MKIPSKINNRRYTNKEKFRYTLLILTGSRTVAGIAKETRISPVTLRVWRDEMIKNGHNVFKKHSSEAKTSEKDKTIKRQNLEIRLLKKLLEHYKKIQENHYLESPDTS